MANPVLESFRESPKASMTNSSRPTKKLEGKENPDLPSVCLQKSTVDCLHFYISDLNESTYSPGTRLAGTSTSSISVHWKKTAPGAQSVSPKPCRPVPRGGNSNPLRQSGLSQPMSVELQTGIGFMVHSEPAG